MWSDNRAIIRTKPQLTNLTFFGDNYSFYNWLERSAFWHKHRKTNRIKISFDVSAVTEHFCLENAKSAFITRHYQMDRNFKR